ncbi:hypothetical protein HDR65_01540 [bacterium]|nr:hypothetical protein [bacterium]MBD5392211.1 hypothetical protein [bacterium]
MKRTLWTFWAKRPFCLLALVTVGLLTACHKSEEDPYAGYIDPVKVLSFGEKVGTDAIDYDNVMKYANDPRIEQIIYFLDSTNGNNNYTGFSTNNISIVRGFLQKCLDYTPKATGAGTFIFTKGKASVEDSLWFIQNGWKIRTW